ncbi:DUF1080 domain-containing protein [Tamlana sp. I1]|uniref:3-keto-disaccharide hydrolase n=1 Tax=Tamlana sp. I1 TaxID=2762061 RepID=UPI00188DDECB|nr:DUF1080 domain-containing protein [Tamlana sp. I1]
MKKFSLSLLICFILMACSGSVKKENTIPLKEPTDPKDTEIWSPAPPTVNPVSQNGAPSDAIVLFDGTNFDEWVSAEGSEAINWKINQAEKSMTIIPDSSSGSIKTKRDFGSVQLHLEWKSPSIIDGDGQNRGNSGVFLQSKYEVQILDNNNNETYVNGQVGAIYKQAIPLAKASVPTGAWNTYDIIYHEPIFNKSGEKTKSATITVLHNGVLIQDHFEIKGTTEYIGFPKNIKHGKAPLFLQDHHCAVSFRNIWIRNLD